VNDHRGIVLYLLQLIDGAGWSAVEHSVAVVDPGEDQTARELLSEVHSQQMTYVADRLCMVVA